MDFPVQTLPLSLTSSSLASIKVEAWLAKEGPFNLSSFLLITTDTKTVPVLKSINSAHVQVISSLLSSMSLFKRPKKSHVLFFIMEISSRHPENKVPGLRSAAFSRRPDSSLSSLLLWTSFPFSLREKWERTLLR